MGDVSDHGIQSALLMISARALIRQQAHHSDDIVDIVNEVNQHLCRDLQDSGYFMTLLLCEIDTSKKTIQWVRAGHDPGILYDKNSESFSELSGFGLPLGIFENSEYDKSRLPLAPGQIFLFGTDGVWEAHNSKGEMFGKHAVKEIIRAHAHQNAKNIIDEVLQKIVKFTHKHRKEDDVTLVVIKVDEDL